MKIIHSSRVPLLLVAAALTVVTIEASRLGGTQPAPAKATRDTLSDLINGRISRAKQPDTEDQDAAEHNRDLQTKTEYTTNYIARLRFLLDLACSASKPALKIQCGPEGTLEILRFGHDSLVALEQTENEATVGSTCADRADCERVFLTNDVAEDRFGEIYFQCTGDYEEATTARIETLPSSGEVECGDAIFDTRAFYIIELGVWCDPEDTVADGFYSYAPYYFECKDGWTLDEQYSGNRYSCATGRNCGGLPCTEPQIDPVAIEAKLDIINERGYCGSTQANTVPGEAEPAPPTSAPFVPPAGDYTMRHQALWAFQYDDFWCGGFLPTTQVKCLGGGMLTFIDKLNEETECDVLDDSTMNCTETCGSCNHWEWENLSGITFECSGPTMEAARSEATYFSDTAHCESSSVYSSTPGVAHRLRLGLYCGSAMLGGDFEFNDYYTECAAGSWHNQENGEASYFECLEYKALPLTGTREEHTFSDVVIYTENITEDVYETMRAGNCFTADFAPTAPTTPVPTTAPVTAAPTEPTSDGLPTGIGIGIGIGEGSSESTAGPTLAPESYCLATCNCTASGHAALSKNEP